MVAKKINEKTYERVELNDAIDESLGENDIWNDLISSNSVPAVTVKGIELRQPTKAQVEAWRASTDPVAGEIVLFGQETYDKLQKLFDPLPQSAWTNFNEWYLDHMFGIKVGELGN